MSKFGIIKSYAVSVFPVFKIFDDVSKIAFNFSHLTVHQKQNHYQSPIILFFSVIYLFHLNSLGRSKRLRDFLRCLQFSRENKTPFCLADDVCAVFSITCFLFLLNASSDTHHTDHQRMKPRKIFKSYLLIRLSCLIPNPFTPSRPRTLALIRIPFFIYTYGTFLLGS